MKKNKRRKPSEPADVQNYTYYVAQYCQATLSVQNEIATCISYADMSGTNLLFQTKSKLRTI